MTQGSEDQPEDDSENDLQTDPGTEGEPSIAAQFDAAVTTVCEEYAADVFFYSGGINDSGFGKLTAAVARNKTHSKVLLILTTLGGSANSAYQIARML
jgi:ClpP class serine protease